MNKKEEIFNSICDFFNANNEVRWILLVEELKSKIGELAK